MRSWIVSCPISAARLRVALRSVPTFHMKTAYKAGLTPISANPLEQFTRYIDAMGTTIHQAQIMEDLKPWAFWNKSKSIGASGVPDPYFRGETPPPGYEPLKMPWATRQRGPITERAWVPRDMAYSLNQAYSTGLKAGFGEPFYQALARAKNTPYRDRAGWSAVSHHHGAR